MVILGEILLKKVKKSKNGPFRAIFGCSRLLKPNLLCIETQKVVPNFTWGTLGVSTS